MTYCVGMVLNEGLVFASDSRTNAGVDHVSTFCKMTVMESPGEGVIVMLNSGTENIPALILGFVAVVLGTLNVVGGFVVTDRMLEMFKKKK